MIRVNPTNTVKTLASPAAAKAWVAAVLAFLGPIVYLLSNGDPITTRGIVTAVVTGLVAGLATFGVPNAGVRYVRKATHRDASR
jgi:hypothetical protein